MLFERNATPLTIEIGTRGFHDLMRTGTLRIIDKRGQVVANLRLALPEETRPFWEWVGAEGEVRLAARLGSTDP